MSWPRRPCISPLTSRGSASFTPGADILMVGTFGNPQEEGSMAVFPTRASAEAFVEGDPFVLEDVVRSWQIRDWNEILTSGA
jgi:hypothetical protein